VVTTVWTIGHSTRTAAELVETLQAFEIELVIDVRRFPGSRRLPQFNGAALEELLEANGIGYRWIEALGGRRRPDPASLNTGWRHPAFRAYADHIVTEEFADGLFELLMLARGLRTAIMCSEILWWRCHRRLIADVLTSLGVEVIHIRDATHSDLHKFTSPARMVRGQLAYVPA
jgi:uncharacterized protein (DUF488 family)